MTAPARTPPVDPKLPPDGSRTRLWLYRGLALLGLPALLLLGLELSLRLVGVGQSPHFLIPDAQPGFLRTNPDYLSLFLPPAFDLRPLNFRVAMPKPANTVRIVVLGESAAQGVPEPKFGFAPQLRGQLRARFPNREIEVLDAGIVAINSHVVRYIADDMLACSPDLVVVYLGNNEVVGPYGPGCAYLSATPPLWLIRTSLWARTTRIGQLLVKVFARVAELRGGSREWGGMSMFVDHGVAGDDPRLERVYTHFESNLRSILDRAAGDHVPVVLSTVASNVQDCAPFLSRHRSDLSAGELKRWQTHYDRGRLAWWLGENDAARRDLTAAVELDPQFAEAEFLLGRAELALGDMAAVRGHLIAAEHWDALRFRPDPRINAIVRQLHAERPAVAFVDAALELGSDAASTVAPAGRMAFFEHVHFDWPGNYQLARSLAQAAADALHLPADERTRWQNSDECAATLGYTAHARAAVTRKNWTLVQAPPFTNQLTYPVDQAQVQRELDRQETAAHQRPVLLRAKSTVTQALAADSQNPSLWKLNEEIDDDLGDVSGALDDIRKQQALQPESFALSADEAIKLARLGETSAAEARLRETARRAGARDLTLLAPAFVDLFTRTQRLPAAQEWLEARVREQPRNAKLQLLLATVFQREGNGRAAETIYRNVLRKDPGNQEALESLVELLRQADNNAAILELGVGALTAQPNNHANNLRTALLARQHEKPDTELAALRAAERSGPITAAIAMRLGRKLLDAGATAEGLEQLAIARQLALTEGDDATAAQLSTIIADLRPPR